MNRPEQLSQAGLKGRGDVLEDGCEIAARLMLSKHTVHRHLQNAYARLGCFSRTAAGRRQTGWRRRNCLQLL
jgi:Bacterial regulatory proteins, luxR family